MKKIVVTIVFLILAVTFFSFLSFDTIETIEAKEREYGGYNITNQMKSGETINLSVSYSVKPLADDVYHIRVNISEQNSTDIDRKNTCKYYSIRNICVEMSALGGPIVEYAAYSGTDKSHTSASGTPNISYNDDTMEISYETSGSSIALDMFVTGKLDLSELELTYDIKGKGVRILNSFIDNTVSLNCDENLLTSHTNTSSE